MSNMSDLDIILTNHKLSEAQKNAVLELVGEGKFVGAKPNTIKSLVNKGLVEERLDGYSLSDSLADEIRPILDHNKVVFEAFETVQAVQEVMLGTEGGENGNAAVVEPWADWELEMMGLSGFRNTDVWTGLSFEEIKEDVKTAYGTNRKARRAHTKLLTSEYRKVFCPRPRKALKITGKVGV